MLLVECAIDNVPIFRTETKLVVGNERFIGPVGRISDQ